MKVRKLLAGFLSAAMVLGTMSFPVFAENDTYTVTAENTLDDVISQINTSASDDVVINLETDATLQLPDYYTNLVNDDVTSLTINGNDHTLDVDATYRLKFNMAGTLKLNNVTVKSDYFEANTWDSWDFLFNCDVEFTNVIFNREMALEKNAVLTGVTINNSSTDDSYAIWIPATQKTVVMDNVTINAAGTGKRGIKIDEQYVDSDKIGVVGLTVNNSTFNTYKKSAILVKSKAGANIVASNNNIENVKADTTNLVWVDSDASASYPKVKVTIDGEPVAPYLEEKGTGVACIGNSYYMTLADAVAAAQDGDTVTILQETNAEDISIPALTNVTIEGAEGIKPVLKNVYEISASANNVTFSNIEFSQTKKTLKIQGKNITFKDCDFNAKTLGYWSVQDTEIFNGCSNITTIENAENITFENCNFDGMGNDYELPNARLINGPSTNNLTIKNCSFTNAFSGIYYGNVKGSYLVEDSYFDVYAYTTHNGGDVHADTFIIRNTTLNGWTSYAGVGQTTFENCKFGGEGSYHTLQAYNNTEINNCTFSNNFNVYAGSQSNFNWSVNNSMRNGEYIRRPDQFFAADDLDWTYQNYTFTFPSEAKVIDTAKTTGAEITLNNLNAHENVDINEDATYKVVVSTAPAGDVAKANGAIKANNDTNTSKAIFDISVKKIDSYGVETDLGGNEDHSVKNQQVTLTLGETPDNAKPVLVYHVDGNGVATKITTPITVTGNKVTFTAPSFSTYAVTYTATALAESDITNNIGVKFERIADTSSYNIVLKALDGKTINRFMSADLTFAMDVKEGAVDYTITPAANINLIDNGNGRYEFNLDGLTSSGATGTEITIGTVTFDGYGKIDFEVSDVSTNIVNTATANDNIVDSYTIAGDGTTTGRLDLSNKLTNVEFKAPKKDLTVNVAFPNTVKNNAKAYQDMKVTISGGDLSAPIVRKLGSDNGDVTFASDTYTTTIADELTLNTSYTVTVSGAGYRTARYTVTMTKDKTLNFWNNAKNNDAFIEDNEDNSKRKVTFLAGEIVKDNNINIYDLSAVVSYFGTSNEVDASSQYAKYDLNRDGKIDSKDIAYVLVSWGK